MFKRKRGFITCDRPEHDVQHFVWLGSLKSHLALFKMRSDTEAVNLSNELDKLNQNMNTFSINSSIHEDLLGAKLPNVQ